MSVTIPPSRDRLNPGSNSCLCTEVCILTLESPKKPHSGTGFEKDAAGLTKINRI